MTWKIVPVACMVVALLVFGRVAQAQSTTAAPADVPTAADAPAPMPAPQPNEAGNEQGTYKLGSGDKLRVIVFGEDDLGGEYEVDGSGYVRLPLIGQIRAAGLTVFDFEAEVASKLNDGYLKDAKISVEVVSYRPFYIIGEVNKPGEYPYVNGMSVLNAVALAGGYTYRADSSEVFVQRFGATKEEQLPADQTTKVNPGDIIRVAERFF
jgi:polysaccharide export outer membrane protein